ncbi:Mitochondrial inner membrane protein oxa1l, partial [Halocaridina rubra]
MPSSSYHTRSRASYKLAPKHKFSQFSTTVIHRNSSYFTSLLQNVFVLKASEPLLPGTDVVNVSSHDSTGVESATVLEKNSTIDIYETTPISGANVELPLDSITYIPPPPVPPEPVTLPLNALGEATLQSVGLGGWSPVGIIQNSLEYLHVTFDLPWWGAIGVATVCIRMLIFPMVLLSQKNAAKMNNNLPQLQTLQMKLTEARQSGNHLEAARLAQEMMIFMKEKEISPVKNMIVPLAQAPIFISMFMGLRGMANLPLESFKEGGLFWFVDLTLSDPYYLLPVITAVTMLATIE